MKLGDITGAAQYGAFIPSNGMNSRYCGSDPGNTRIRMNPQIRIRIGSLWIEATKVQGVCAL